MAETFTVRHGNGSTFTLRAPTDGQVNLTLTRGIPYEREVVELMAALCSAGDVVVDIGAHIGNHSVYVGLATEVEIHAFEPNPWAFDFLSANVEASGLTDRVHCHRMAIGAEIGTASMPKAGDSGWGRVDPSEDGEIKVTPLESVYDGPIRLMKVDVEGFETQVISGAAGLLRRRRPLVFMEVQDRASLGQMRELGYRRVPVNLASTPTYLFVSRWREAWPVLRHRAFWYSVVRSLGRPLRDRMRRARAGQGSAGASQVDSSA